MFRPTRNQERRKLAIATLLASVALSSPALLGLQKPNFKPGYNFYTAQQDVLLGKESSAQVDKQLRLIDDPQLLTYVGDLGKRLVALAPNNRPEYAWQFKIVNSPEINAFALPGGYIYLNRGVLEAVENEAQLAGVIAHECGHVVMRHATHIASQALLAQGGAAILTGLFGQSGTLASQAAQLGLGLGVNSLMLKNSREAESQADQVGTFILYQAGYDPHAMAQFFEIISKKYPQRTAQFFSDHPNPDNRIKAVDAQISQLGPPRAPKADSLDFAPVKQFLSTLAPPPTSIGTPQADAKVQPPPLPSATLIRYDNRMFSLDYPDNWRVEQVEDGVELFPPGGMVRGAEGATAQAYGAAVSLYAPSEESWGLVEATQDLLASMHQSNPQMRVVQQTGLNLGGNPAVSTLLQNDSPIDGQRETDHLVTVRYSDSVLTFIFIAPAGAFDSYSPTFNRILQSIALARETKVR